MSDDIRSDSRYLHGDDLRKGDQWSEFTLTVKEVGDKNSATDTQGKTIEGWPVTFQESPKILVLRPTNERLAIAAMGTNKRSEWAGKTLTVYPAVLKKAFGQDNVVCLRVRVPIGVPAPFVQPKHMGRDLTQ